MFSIKQTGELNATAVTLSYFQYPLLCLFCQVKHVCLGGIVGLGSGSCQKTHMLSWLCLYRYRKVTIFLLCCNQLRTLSTLKRCGDILHLICIYNIDSTSFICYIMDRTLQCDVLCALISLKKICWTFESYSGGPTEIKLLSGSMCGEVGQYLQTFWWTFNSMTSVREIVWLLPHLLELQSPVLLLRATHWSWGHQGW